MDVIEDWGYAKGEQQGTQGAALVNASFGLNELGFASGFPKPVRGRGVEPGFEDRNQLRQPLAGSSLSLSLSLSLSPSA